MRVCSGASILVFHHHCECTEPWLYASLGSQRFSTWHLHPTSLSWLLSGNHLLSHQLCFLKHTCKLRRLSCWDHDPTQLVSLDRAIAPCDHLKHLQSFYFVFHFIWASFHSWFSFFLKSPLPPQYVYPDIKTWFFFLVSLILLAKIFWSDSTFCFFCRFNTQN